MRLTGKQQKVLQHTLAYCPCDFDPTAADVEDFLNYTDKGIQPSKRSIGFYELLGAWQAWTPSTDKKGYWASWTSRQQRRWMDAHFSGDIPLAMVAMDFVRDAIGDPWVWFRQLPAYIDLCCLRARIRSGGHRVIPTGP